ncbi:MAG TPA: HAD family hydrolase, partial [Gemmatimonadaceae bacterium]|nr:HAD family hydrolase [Gemmatimonadaceae bacterium]
MASTTDRSRLVFLLDVDNTLLDNDHIVADLSAELTREVGVERQARYWTIFEECRATLGYADYLGTLQRYRVEDPHDPHLLAIALFLVNYPFAQRVYDGSFDVIRHLNGIGQTVILTDGDVIFQPLKLHRSGLFDAVDGRVLLCIHKEKELEDVAQRFPADHYVLVDDKVRLLTAIKKEWGARVTTIFPLQGHYAADPEVASYPRPDLTIQRIGDLVGYQPPSSAARTGRPA